MMQLTKTDIESSLGKINSLISSANNYYERGRYDEAYNDAWQLSEYYLEC